MLTQLPIEKTRSDIITYYDQCEIDYRMVWRLGSSQAMHYGHWDEHTRTLRQALTRQNEILAHGLSLEPSHRVLDAGCGVGGSAIYLARAFGCNVHGVTLSAKQATTAGHNAAQSGVADRVQFLVMDYTQLGFEDATFDVVWALESVCYANDKSTFVREAHRVLKPGGTLVVADAFASREKYEKEDETLMRQWLRQWAVNWLDTSDQFALHMQAAGLVDVSYVDVTKHIMPSARQLYLHSLYALPFARIAEAMGMRTPIQTGNVVGCRYQWPVFKGGLARYGILRGRKA